MQNQLEFIFLNMRIYDLQLTNALHPEQPLENVNIFMKKI